MTLRIKQRELSLENPEFLSNKFKTENQNYIKVIFCGTEL